MRRLGIILAVVGLSLVSSRLVFAEAPRQAALPLVLTKGLDAYVLEGPEAAVREWIKGGPIESDPNAQKSAETFKEVESFYGKFKNAELIRVKKVTHSSRLYYLQMNYEKGPLFARFLCYRVGQAWIVSGRFVVDTDPSRVLPPALL